MTLVILVNLRSRVTLALKNGCADLIDPSAVGSTQQEVVGL